jgi:hypothetical protein
MELGPPRRRSKNDHVCHSDTLKTKNVKVLFYPMFPYFRKVMILESSQASSVCPSSEQFVDEEDYGALKEFSERKLVFEGFQSSPTCLSGKSNL